MVRNRTHEAAVVGVLAALATFCALEARGGQPSTVVGQSTAKTASTGKRPLAERIKAANRPIRMTAEAELAPDEGLIRDLSAGDVEAKRDWPVVGPIVEIVESDAPQGAADGLQPSGEPAAVPPPGEDAVAANPTTADDAGMVGEVAGIDATGDGDGAEGDTDASIADETPEATAPRPVPQVRQAPPRRTVTRVTPQRREALLGRLRAALADMPRPFGLLPADEPRPAPRMNRPQPTRSPAPIAVAKAPPTLEPAPSDPASAPVDAPEDAEITSEQIGSAEPVATETCPADAALADAAPAVDAVVDAADETPSATDGLVSDASSDATPAVAAEGAPTDGQPSAEIVDSIADTPTDGEGNDEGEAVPDTVAAVEIPAPDTAETTRRPAPGAAPRQVTRQQHTRTRAPGSIVQRPRPFERLQATLDAMPRPLGILPAPRPEMHAHNGVRRAGTAPQRTMARATPRPAAPAAATQSPTAPGSLAMEEPVGSEPAVVTAEQEPLAGTDAAESAGTETPDTLATTELPAAATDGEPGAFPADGTTAGDGATEAVACIEVTVEGPDGTIERGSDVTLHLTVRNTGTVAARAVTPVFHFGETMEPKAIAGREGTLTEQGTVVVEALAELGPGESIDVDVVATCHQVGTARFQGVVWCGEGDSAEQVPVDGELRVVPARIATAPEGRTRR